MSDQTPIEWTHWTWNPLAGFLREAHTVTLVGGKRRTFPAGTRGWFCTKVSPGCLNCYAEAINLRLGNGLEYKAANLDNIEWRLVNLLQPLRKRVKDGRNRVFVNSMTDLFHEAVPDHLIKVLLVVMACARDWDFQVLTKRARRMREFFDRYDFGDCVAEVRAWDCGEPSGSKPWEIEAIPVVRELWWRARALDVLEKLPNQWPLPNVWLGVSAEDQTRADERIPHLLRTPAAVRFVSGEPLLGAVDFTPDSALEAGGIDWLILGGESGRGSRACNIYWMRDAREAAQSRGVPVMVKQLGKKAVVGPAEDPIPLNLKHPKGGDMAEWPADLRVRQFPT